MVDVVDLLDTIGVIDTISRAKIFSILNSTKNV